MTIWRSKLAQAVQTMRNMCDEMNACCDCPFGYDGGVSERCVCMLAGRPSDYDYEHIMDYLSNFDGEE